MIKHKHHMSLQTVLLIIIVAMFTVLIIRQEAFIYIMGRLGDNDLAEQRARQNVERIVYNISRDLTPVPTLEYITIPREAMK